MSVACCKDKLRHKADRLRKLCARDEKRLARRKAELREVAALINERNNLPHVCAVCEGGE